MPAARRPPAHRPRRRFAQNFLHERGVIERIVAAVDPRPGQRLLEIGPGLGALTEPLLERAGRLEVVELDRDLAAHLERTYAARGGLRVHAGDVLDLDLPALAAGGRLRVVGNLPYNVSTPVLFHLLAHRGTLDDMHLMLQREVVERLAAPPGGAARGRLSVMVQAACRVEKLFTVGAGAFRPAPRVTSAFVRLTVQRTPPVPIEHPAAFAEVVARAFGGRRKTLRNSLRGLLGEAAIRAAGVDPGARPETLGLEHFAALAEACAAQRGH